MKNLKKQKNVIFLIKSVHELIKSGCNIHLYLFGQGELYADLIQYVSKNKITNYISFEGFKNNWKREALGADCFVLPTSREGMPNVLFEAASVGLPIISTNIEEIACHFTDHYDALLVNPKDIVQLKNAINKLFTDRDFAKRIAKNASETIKKYSKEKMVHNYEKIYLELLQTNIKNL